MTQLQPVHDLLVIGGGINGVGIAADAAGRGLDVVLCEKSDLAGATSSCSSKLIHGGLRYLEFYEFGMVRKSLLEREVLTQAAPHLIKPITFQIPQLPHSRNSWLLRAGLLLYDHLAKRKRFKRSRAIRFDSDGPLNAAIKRGFEYSDAQVDDARLVILNAQQAHRKGATILTRTECTAIKPTDESWRVTLRDHLTDVTTEQSFKVIVNATGPWVASLIDKLTDNPVPHRIRLVKGSHIVVPRIHDGDQAFLLQHVDGRIVFVIPWLQEYSLIGTTEQEIDGVISPVHISREEITYLTSIVSLYFKKPILRSEIIYSFAGIRPLIDEAGKDSTRVSRDFRLELDLEPHPLLSVYGGKVTTYRVLAEQVLDRLVPFFPQMRAPWTKQARLPGGDFDIPENLFREIASRYLWLPPDLITRWQNSYGTLIFDILGNATRMSDLGTRFGYNLYQKEVDYLCTHEWARTVDDILWRRTKLGLHFSEKERSSLVNYIKQSFSTS